MTADRSVDWGRTIVTGALLACAAGLLVGMLAAFGSEKLGYDFHASYLPAAEAILDGETPYPQPGGGTLESDRGYVYPPLLALVVLPFAALPVDVAAFLAVVGMAAALLGALALVGVRDLRCFAAVLVSAPAWNALEMANVSALLALALALVWRLRDDARRSGAVLGLAVSVKLLVWPLLVWALAIGRARAAGWAVAVAVVATSLSWAAIGFAGLVDYPDLLRRLSEVQSERSYSFVGIASALGLDREVGQVAMLVVGAGLLAACAVVARRGDDLASFTCAIAAALALAPIIWLHYLVLLFVPLGIARPRFSVVWLLPTLLWLSPRAGNGDGVEVLLPVLVATVLVTSTLLAGSRHVRRLAEAL